MNATQPPATHPTQNVLFTIVIPALNEEHFLPNLLNDLVKQTDRAFEVIVADGGSTDKTVDVARKYKDTKTLRLKIHISNEGNVAHQRNEGAKLAAGMYLVFVDADSRVDTGFVASMSRVVHEHPTGIYLTRFYPDSTSPILRLSYWMMNYFVCAARILPKPLSSVGSVFIKRSIFSQISGYDESIYIGEDHNLVRRTKQAGQPVICAHSVSVSFSLRRIRHEGMLKSLFILFFGIGYAIFKGDIRKKYFTYNMGGAAYSPSATPSQTLKQ
jgi:glycosyltransferase involved in cell wall biosynthesis